MQADLGNRWSLIAQSLPGRTEDAVKIRWKSLMRSRRAQEKERIKNSGKSKSTSSARKKKHSNDEAASSLPNGGKKRSESDGTVRRSSVPTRPSVHMHQISPPRASWDRSNPSTAPPAAPIPKVEAVLGARPVSLSQSRAPSCLGTPREEWGTSPVMGTSTTRNHSGSSSSGGGGANGGGGRSSALHRSELSAKSSGQAAELLQQQRLRLLLMEKEKGKLIPSFQSSVLSPGHVMLTKQLEEAQERQKHQSMLETGWKAAAELNYHTAGEHPSDDQHDHLEGFLDKLLPVAPKENFFGGDGTIILQSANSSEKI